MVKELTETRILSPPPKKFSKEIKTIPKMFVENENQKNSIKKTNKSTNNNKIGKKTTANKKKNDNSNNLNDTELKKNIKTLENQNSKVLYYI